MKDSDDETIKGLMYAAFEQAFQSQLAQLYKIYISNITTVPDQVAHTKKGIENAVAAYRLALSAVDSWES